MRPHCSDSDCKRAFDFDHAAAACADCKKEFCDSEDCLSTCADCGTKRCCYECLVPRSAANVELVCAVCAVEDEEEEE